MISDSTRIARFKLAASGEQLQRMNEEIPTTPTYRIKLVPEDHTMTVVYKKEAKSDQSITTDTAIIYPSLKRKLQGGDSSLDPDMCNRYMRSVVLGEGGAGVVYEMRDLNIGRDVAVKVLKEVQSVEDRESFIQEGMLAAKLEHPNIIPIYDLDADQNGQVYLTMKKVQGRDLKSYIHEEPSLSFEEIILIFLKVCDALEYAHSLDKIHQDVKPDNIMIGEYGEVFLIDWGASSQNGEDLHLSPVYMSPEQAQGFPPAITDDIYCLGASLFHILTRRFPTNASTIDELWERKVAGDVDMPTAKERRGIPKPLLAIALKAMHIVPERRYASVRDFADDLKAYQAGFATVAEGAGLFTHLGLFIKRRLKETVLAAAAVVLVVVIGIGYYHTINQAKVRTVEAEKGKVEAELMAYKLIEERRERWHPVLDQEFGKAQTVDPRLNVSTHEVRNGKVFIGFRSDLERLEIDEYIDSEPMLELSFYCSTIPSIHIAFQNQDYMNSRVFNIKHVVSILDYSRGFNIPYIGANPVLDALHQDRPNRLLCWRRENTWYLEINGVRFVEFYDSDLSVGTQRTKISVYRHVPLCDVGIESVRVWNRHRPDYVSILEQGRLLQRLGKYQEARDWYLVHGKSRENAILADEASYLAAIVPGVDDDVVERELSEIAENSESAFRYHAMHKLAIRAAMQRDIEKTFSLLAEISERAPEFNTMDEVWPSVRGVLRDYPPKEKIAALRRLAGIPSSLADLRGMKVNDISFLKKSKAVNFYLGDNPLSDLSPLKDLNVRMLDIGNTLVTDISPLSGLDIIELRAEKSRIADFTPLAGKSLDLLLLKGSKHIDFSSLKNVKASNLILDSVPINDPAYLSHMDPKMLRIRNCGLENLDFLKGVSPVQLLADGNRIVDISGVEGQEFTIVSLIDNKISDLSPIRRSKIKMRLNLAGNLVEDISPLEGQPLRSLDISRTGVRDLSVLRSLKNLNNLSIDGPTGKSGSETSKDGIPDLSTLGTMDLDRLSLESRGVKDVSQFKSCRITTALNLRGNPVEDISGLAGQPLKNLDLGDTNVKDLSPLAELANLRNLSLDCSSERPGDLENVNGLKGLKLETLSAVNHRVTDVSALKGCKNLTELNLSGNPLTDLHSLNGLDITTLYLNNAPISDLGFVRGLPRLNTITISGSAEKRGLVEDLSAFENRSVKTLDLAYNKISSIEPLRSATILGKLNLSGNPISDISALEGQPLWYLDISGTDVQEISVLKTLKSLRALKVSWSKYDEEKRRFLLSLGVKLSSDNE